MRGVACTIFSLAVLLGCAERDEMPTACERIEGAWKYEWPGITVRYNFHAGACDAYAIVPAQPVQYYAYAYACECDTLEMLDLASGDARKAAVSFPTDSTAVLSWEDGVDYHLKRI